jgi:hypothetical protein
MPEHILKLLKQIESKGGTWKKDSSGHYQIYKNGIFCGGIAVGHSKRVKRDEVEDVYIRRVMRNLDNC